MISMWIQALSWLAVLNYFAHPAIVERSIKDELWAICTFSGEVPVRSVPHFVNVIQKIEIGDGSIDPEKRIASKDRISVFFRNADGSHKAESSRIALLNNVADKPWSGVIRFIWKLPEVGFDRIAGNSDSGAATIVDEDGQISERWWSPEWAVRAIPFGFYKVDALIGNQRPLCCDKSLGLQKRSVGGGLSGFGAVSRISGGFADLQKSENQGSGLDDTYNDENPSLGDWLLGYTDLRFRGQGLAAYLVFILGVAATWAGVSLWWRRSLDYKRWANLPWGVALNFLGVCMLRVGLAWM